VAVLLLAVAGPLGGEAQAQEEDEARAGSVAPGEAKNVIFMMGDGMGPAQRDAIQLATVGAYDRLVMDSLPIEGMVGTNSVDPETFVTDSAAGATSFATGVKTFNGAVGVDADGNAVPTVLEQAKAAGKSVGLVTTSQVTDASPAAFASHVEDRDEQSEIARQYIEDTGVDVILGGGEDRWLPEGNEGAFPDKKSEDDEEVSQSDGGNLIAEAQNLGYEYVNSADGLAAATSPKVLGLFANEEMFQQFPEGQGDEYDPVVPLPEMTSKAIDILSQNKDGFFLFVEEEAIDEMGHANNGRLQIKAGQALDDAVSVAKDYTDASGDTLLIVTADHECCGLVVEGPDDPEYPDESGGNEKDENANLSTEDGPFDVANSDYEFIMDWTTTGHTAVDVPLTATGPASDSLTGNYENTAVYGVMANALGVAGLTPTSASQGATTMPETGGVALVDTSGAVPAWLLAGLGLLAGAVLVGGFLLLKPRG
jgi:alkaline phosphatase